MARTVGLEIEAPEPEKFPCPHCDKEYKSAEALQRHVDKEHTPPPENE